MNDPANAEVDVGAITSHSKEVGAVLVGRGGRVAQGAEVNPVGEWKVREQEKRKTTFPKTKREREI